VEKLVALGLAGLAVCACDPEEKRDPAVESLRDPQALFCSSGSSVLVLDDSVPASVVALDPEEGTMRRISQIPWFGDGDNLHSPRIFTVSSSGEHAYVVTQDALMRVDLPSGDRRTLMKLSHKDAIPLLRERVTDIAVTEDEDKLFLSDESLGFIAVDLVSLQRTIVRGRDPLDSPEGITGILKGVTLLHGHEVWTAQYLRSSLLQLDPMTGEVLRDIIIARGSPFDVEAGAKPGTAIVLMGGGEADHGIWSVDLESGAASEISTDRRGEGPPFETPNRFCVDAAAQRAFVLDLNGRKLWRVDLDSGDRTVLLEWEERR
jgi:hypothetical protein